MVKSSDKTMYPAKVSLVLTGDALDSKHVTEIIGLTPIRAWSKGLQYTSRSGRRLTRQTGLWAFGYEGEEVPSLLIALLSSMEPRAEALRAASQYGSAEIAISIWWDPCVAQSEFCLKSSLLTRLGAVARRWSFYYPGARPSGPTGFGLLPPASEANKEAAEHVNERRPSEAAHETYEAKSGAHEVAVSRATVELLQMRSSRELSGANEHICSNTGNSSEATGQQVCIGSGPRVADAVTSFFACREQQTDVIQTLARSRDAKLGIRICWMPADGYGGFDLESSDVVRLSEVCDGVLFRFDGLV